LRRYSPSGTWEPAFDLLAETFARGFSERGEVGAAVCVYLDGRKVADLWGGYRDSGRTLPWEADTLVNMMSVTKSMAALCAHALIEDGTLALEEKVSTYWAQFAQEGKAEITVRQLISHHAALIYADAAPEGGMFDWDAVIAALERQRPEWTPGTLGAYHSATYGYLVAELIRRACGRDLPEILRERFTQPLGIDFFVGMTPEQEARTAQIITNPLSASLKAFADPTTKLGRAQRLRIKGPELFNSPGYRRGFLPSSNGHGNARSVARLYGALARGGEIDDVRVLSDATVRTLRTEQWSNVCGLTDREYRMGMGVFLRCPPLVPFGPNDNSFGHPGVGGAVGFADPHLRLGFSYSPNFMCAGAGVGDRCEALIDATYRCVQASR
jgi:CubicO group peptidase (beta-lactamase class C family)